MPAPAAGATIASASDCQDLARSILRSLPLPGGSTAAADNECSSSYSDGDCSSSCSEEQGSRGVSGEEGRSSQDDEASEQRASDLRLVERFAQMVAAQLASGDSSAVEIVLRGSDERVQRLLMEHLKEELQEAKHAADKALAAVAATEAANEPMPAAAAASAAAVAELRQAAAAAAEAAFNSVVFGPGCLLPTAVHESGLMAGLAPASCEGVATSATEAALLPADSAAATLQRIGPASTPAAAAGSTAAAAAAAAGSTAAGSSAAAASSSATAAGSSAAALAAAPAAAPAAQAGGTRRRRKPRCAACGGKDVPRFKVCAGCDIARYCNAQCQKEHWPQHRQVCLKQQQGQGAAGTAAGAAAGTTGA
jgi:hypothetical protein